MSGWNVHVFSLSANSDLCVLSCRGRVGSPSSVPAHGLPVKPRHVLLGVIQGDSQWGESGHGSGLSGAPEESLTEAALSHGAPNAHRGPSGQQGPSSPVAAWLCSHTSPQRGLRAGPGRQAQHLPGVPAGLARTSQTEQQPLRKVLHAGITAGAPRAGLELTLTLDLTLKCSKLTFTTQFCIYVPPSQVGVTFTNLLLFILEFSFISCLYYFFCLFCLFHLRKNSLIGNDSSRSFAKLIE